MLQSFITLHRIAPFKKGIVFADPTSFQVTQGSILASSKGVQFESSFPTSSLHRINRPHAMLLGNKCFIPLYSNLAKEYFDSTNHMPSFTRHSNVVI